MSEIRFSYKGLIYRITEDPGAGYPYISCTDHKASADMMFKFIDWASSGMGLDSIQIFGTILSITMFLDSIGAHLLENTFPEDEYPPDAVF